MEAKAPKRQVAAVKTILAVANARAEDEFALTPRRVLELATIEGARTMGADHEIGSLRPGKRADVIAVSSRGWPGEQVEFLVMDAQPADIHSVFVGGVPTRTDAIG